MKILLQIKALILLCTLFPASIFGFDLPGYATYHGKIIDADTLKPIEGAVVWAIWDSCGPGIGHGPVCSTGTVKEVLTDANGEWQITGPSGNSDPGFLRTILGFIVSWTEPPRIGYYMPGYFPFLAKLGIGDFSAYAYTDKSKNIEGIVLHRRNNMEEWKLFMEESRKYGGSLLIPTDNPERKLRELDFDFQYPENVKRIYDSITNKTTYKVIGLKRAVTPEEKREARGLGINYIEFDTPQPLLRKALKY